MKVPRGSELYAAVLTVGGMIAIWGTLVVMVILAIGHEDGKSNRLEHSSSAPLAQVQYKRCRGSLLARIVLHPFLVHIPSSVS